MKLSARGTKGGAPCVRESRGPSPIVLPRTRFPKLWASADSTFCDSFASSSSAFLRASCLSSCSTVSTLRSAGIHSTSMRSCAESSLTNK